MCGSWKTPCVQVWKLEKMYRGRGAERYKQQMGWRKWGREKMVWRNHAILGLLRIDRLTLAGKPPNQGRSGPSFAQVGPNAAKASRSKSIPLLWQFGPVSTNFGAMWTEAGPMSAMSGLDSDKFGRIWAKLEHVQPKSGDFQAKAGRSMRRDSTIA